ncbi:ferric reductase like transmembrane component [Colletotrichum asianum]|uniref:Ferric reductase like transmembrane component n=1 Tax=Colletotrichum asianum TaxID=702518 RepID=A0A8H3ZJC1_9PEZI|nr:ferric reductase like transmembrane component [Colletotrichum asianum]
MRYWQLDSAVCYIVVIFFISTQAAASEAYGRLCGTACRKTFRTLRFSDAPTGAFFAVQECTSHLYQRSLYLCWDLYCSKEIWLAESKSLNRSCQDMDGSHFPPRDIINDITDEDIAQIARFNETSPDRAQRVDVLMLPSQPYYVLWARTLDAHDYIWDQHFNYGWAMGMFWAVVIALGIANRALMLWGPSFAQSHARRHPSSLWLKCTILTPAMFGRRCVQDFGGWGTLPPRVQTLTLTLFLLLNVMCTVFGYRIFEGYGLTGIFSFANFPLIWLFGMRNNLVIWLTGWDFKTYNNFHRWVARVARVATLEAVIHSIGYTLLILRRGGWAYFWRMCNLTYWWTGELVSYFCNYWHVSIFRGDYDPLVWVPAMIWLVDRIIRGARIVAFSPRFWKAWALVTYNEDAHMIRVVVPIFSSLYTIEPGTFYYLMVLNKWNFWKSHPFTVASVSESARCGESLGERSPLLDHRASSPEDTRARALGSGRQMTFLIRPYDSFTSRLKDYAETEKSKPATVLVAIDGPYGKSLPLERFSKVLFVVGGSGIAVPLSYLKKLTTSRSRPKLIGIHWAIRQVGLAVDVLTHELKDVSSYGQVKIHVHVTTMNNRRIGDQATYRLAEWKFHRLNVEKVIQAILNTGEEGSLAVVASGPGRMADESRRAVAVRMVSSEPRIEYFEESFQW